MRYELASRPRRRLQILSSTSPQAIQFGNLLKHSIQRRDVVSAIHATNVPGTWVECKGRVHSEFSTRKSNSSITVLPRVLERIPVMLFVGDQDLICNYVGIESMIQAMHWNGETGLGVSES